MMKFANVVERIEKISRNIKEMKNGKGAMIRRWMRVGVSNSKIIEWLAFRISELTNVQILNGRTYESL